MSDLCAKQNVAVALKNTPKGQLSYDSSWNCSFDSLQVCFLPVDSAHLLKKECHMYNLLSRNLEHLIAAYDYFTDTAWDIYFRGPRGYSPCNSPCVASPARKPSREA